MIGGCVPRAVSSSTSVDRDLIEKRLHRVFSMEPGQKFEGPTSVARNWGRDSRKFPQWATLVLCLYIKDLHRRSAVSTLSMILYCHYISLLLLWN